MPYTQKCKSASTLSCVFCMQSKVVVCSILALLLLICIKKSKCVFVYVCVCFYKEGSQVAAPDVLTQLHLCAQECTERRKREKRESRSMLDAVCVPSLGKEYSHALHPKVHECINTELCVLCARQSSGLQLA